MSSVPFKKDFPNSSELNKFPVIALLGEVDNLDRAKELLTVKDEEVSETVSRLTVPPHRVGIDDISLIDIVLKGIRVELGLIVCSFKVPPRLTDDLEITARVLGRRGGYSGTLVLMKNRATGEVIAEGRHSLLFGKRASKL